jgi:hypothetical protein
MLPEPVGAEEAMACVTIANAAYVIATGVRFSDQK